MLKQRDVTEEEKTRGKSDLIRCPSNLPASPDVTVQPAGSENKPCPFLPPPPVPLTILQSGDVERLAAVVSGPDACVCLHHDAVVRVLPQVRDVDVVGRGGEVQVVTGIPKLQAVVGDDPVRQQRRLPGHIHLTGTDRLIGEAVRRTAWDWRENNEDVPLLKSEWSILLLKAFIYVHSCGWIHPSTHHPLQTGGIKCLTFGCRGRNECTPSLTRCSRRMASRPSESLC